MLKLRILIASVLLMPLVSFAATAPGLKITKNGDFTGVIDSVPDSQSTYVLDLHATTGGNNASGLQYHFTVSNPGGGSATYGATPLTMGGNPFTSGDVNSAPAASAAVNNSTTVLFKSSAGDYAAFDNMATNLGVGSYSLNILALNPGVYVFTPVLDELTNAGGTMTPSNSTFLAPGTFSLTVAANPVPEPMSVGVLGMGAAGLLLRRRRV